MKLHRFIGDFNLQKPTITINDREIINQIKNVLRLNVGEEIILADPHSNEALVTIIKLEKDSADVEILTVSQNKNEPKNRVALYCAVLKKESFEIVVQKATEVGVIEIIPIITKRTVKFGLRQDRLEKIVKEAAEQSGRGIVPTISPLIKFEEAVKSADESNDVNFLFTQNGSPFQKISENGARIGIFIGPEGGWDQSEYDLALKSKFQIANLCALTLRAETAAIIASYLATY